MTKKRFRFTPLRIEAFGNIYGFLAVNLTNGDASDLWTDNEALYQAIEEVVDWLGDQYTLRARSQKPRLDKEQEV